MYELVQLTDRCYYLQSPAKIGLVRLSDNRVCLIDSGNDQNAGRKIRQVLDANNWQLAAIYNTHSNADHIGGNQYLHRQTGCKIYAPGVECAFTRHPILQPSFIFGGYPLQQLRHKFMLAAESPAEYLTEGCLPDGWQLLPLPGHYFDMVGFRTADDIVYLGDCLSSRQTLDKYQIGFIYDVAAYLNTLQAVKQMSARLFVPAHADPAEDIAPLADYNIRKVHEIAETILKYCRQPIHFEALLQKLFDHYALQMNFEQYALVGSTLRSYLAWLADSGRLQAGFDQNLLLWTAV